MTKSYKEPSDIIACICAGILSVYLFINFIKSEILENFKEFEGFHFAAFLIIVAAILTIIGYARVCFGMYTGKFATARGGLLFAAFAVLIDLVGILYLLGLAKSYEDLLRTSEGKLVLFVLILSPVAMSISYFLLAEIIKIRIYKQSVMSKWIIPAIICIVTYLINIIVSKSIAESYDLTLSANGLLKDLSTIGMVFFVSLSMKKDEAAPSYED